MGKLNKKVKKKKPSSNKTSHVLDLLLSPPDSTNPKQSSGNGQSSSTQPKNVSTCTMKPPSKKPKFFDKDAKECVSVISQLSKNDHPQQQKISLWPIQIQPLFTVQINTPTFPCIFDEQRRTTPVGNENDDTNAKAENQVVYSVSGTQNLGLECSSGFNLYQEFPIPKYYHAYQRGKTSETNAAIPTGTIEADATGYNETEKLRKPQINSRNNNIPEVLTREFKSPSYRLIDKPKYRRTRKPEIYLSEGAYNSELVLQLTAADEALRGQPPYKKTKLDAEFQSVFVPYIFKDNTAEKITGSSKRPDYMISENKVRSQDSVDYLLEANCKRKQQKGTAKSDFLDDEQSSETEEELRSLDNVDDGMDNMFDFAGINGEQSSDNQLEVSHELQQKKRNNNTYIQNPTVDTGSGSKILQGIHKLASFFSFAKLKNTSFLAVLPEKQSSLTPNVTSTEDTIPRPQEPQSEIQQSVIISKGAEGVVLTKRRSSTPKKERSHREASKPKATVSPNNNKELPITDDDKDDVNGGRPVTKNIKANRSPKTVIETLPDNKARCELEGLLNNKMLETPPKARHTSKHLRSSELDSKKDLLTLANAALTSPEPKAQKVPGKVADADVTSPKSILKSGVVNPLTSAATKNVTIAKPPKSEAKSFLQTILNFFRSTPKQDKKLSFQEESGVNKKPMERKSFFEKLGFKNRKVSDTINDNTEDATAKLDVEKVQNPLVNKHMDSVVVLRQKRMKLFMETREFYEDSIMAYSSVLQGSQCNVPSALQMVKPLNLDSSRPLTLLPSVLLSQSMGMGSFKCTLSESVIEPAISRRKRRLNENLKLFDPHSENANPDNKTKDISSKSQPIEDKSKEKAKKAKRKKDKKRSHKKS